MAIANRGRSDQCLPRLLLSRPAASPKACFSWQRVSRAIWTAGVAQSTTLQPRQKREQSMQPLNSFPPTPLPSEAPSVLLAPSTKPHQGSRNHRLRVVMILGTQRLNPLPGGMIFCEEHCSRRTKKIGSEMGHPCAFEDAAKRSWNWQGQLS